MPTYSSSACAFSRTSRSSRRVDGVRMIEPNRPDFIRECSPIMTFSIAVIVENRRMFWNVRAIPCFITMSGRAPVMPRPSKSIVPNVGR